MLPTGALAKNTFAIAMTHIGDAIQTTWLVCNVVRVALEGNHEQAKIEKRMNNQFDELTKALAQSTTRRAALKRFGAGFTAIVLASMGVAVNAKADPARSGRCHCKKPYFRCSPSDLDCINVCTITCSP